MKKILFILAVMFATTLQAQELSYYSGDDEYLEKSVECINQKGKVDLWKCTYGSVKDAMIIYGCHRVGLDYVNGAAHYYTSVHYWNKKFINKKFNHQQLLDSVRTELYSKFPKLMDTRLYLDMTIASTPTDKPDTLFTFYAKALNLKDTLALNELAFAIAYNHKKPRGVSFDGNIPEGYYARNISREANRYLSAYGYILEEEKKQRERFVQDSIRLARRMEERHLDSLRTIELRKTPLRQVPIEKLGQWFGNCTTAELEAIFKKNGKKYIKKQHAFLDDIFYETAFYDGKFDWLVRFHTTDGKLTKVEPLGLADVYLRNEYLRKHTMPRKQNREIDEYYNDGFEQDASSAVWRAFKKLERK